MLRQKLREFQRISIELQSTGFEESDIQVRVGCLVGRKKN